jgi:hypothetical protein
MQHYGLGPACTLNPSRDEKGQVNGGCVTRPNRQHCTRHKALGMVRIRLPCTYAFRPTPNPALCTLHAARYTP